MITTLFSKSVIIICEALSAKTYFRVLKKSKKN